MIEKETPANDIFEAARDAGRQLVKDGMISPETLEIISQELGPLKMYTHRNKL